MPAAPARSSAARQRGPQAAESAVATLILGSLSGGGRAQCAQPAAGAPVSPYTDEMALERGSRPPACSHSGWTAGAAVLVG